MPPFPQHQQLRSITTPLGAAVLDMAVLAAVLTPPVLIMRFLRRKNTNKKLQGTLSQAHQLSDREKRRQTFFDVARRYARNNGSAVDLEDRPEDTTDATGLGAPTHMCNVTTLDQYNVRYSIQRGSLLRKWKVWVAIDAEFDFSTASKTPSSSSSESTGANGDSDRLPLGVRASREPVTWAAVLLMNSKLSEAGRATGGQAEGSSSHAEVPEEVDIELLFWDTIISLKLNTRTLSTRTMWMGKIGERRPSRFSWIIIPIPTMFDI